MDLQEQNELANEIERLLEKKLKGKEFHAVVAVEREGNGFAFSVSNLSELSNYRSCSLIVNGIGEEADKLAEQFKIPSDARFKLPLEPKV